LVDEVATEPDSADRVDGAVLQLANHADGGDVLPSARRTPIHPARM
jgi:hypothetical protein